MSFFYFSTITNHLLSKVMELIFTMSIWLLLFASSSVKHYALSAIDALAPHWNSLFSCRLYTSFHMIDIVNTGSQNHNECIFALSVLVFWHIILLFTPVSLFYCSIVYCPLSLFRCLISQFMFFVL